MSKHHSNKLAADLAVAQRNEAGCRAALIQAETTLRQIQHELEMVKFDRNYWRAKTEAHEQTIRLQEHQIARKDGQIQELRRNLPYTTDDSVPDCGIVVHRKSTFNHPDLGLVDC